MALQSDQPDQRCFALAWLGILDQQAGSRLVRPRWNQLVVSVDLVLDRVRLRHLLDANHLLDLVPRSLRVLENKRQMRADLEPAPLLERLRKSSRQVRVLMRRADHEGKACERRFKTP